MQRQVQIVIVSAFHDCIRTCFCGNQYAFQKRCVHCIGIVYVRVSHDPTRERESETHTETERQRETKRDRERTGWTLFKIIMTMMVWLRMHPIHRSCCHSHNVFSTTALQTDKMSISTKD